jgi:hypothetical protein
MKIHNITKILFEAKFQFFFSVFVLFYIIVNTIYRQKTTLDYAHPPARGEKPRCPPVWMIRSIVPCPPPPPLSKYEVDRREEK